MVAPSTVLEASQAVSLTYGQTVTGTISAPGEVVTYTFTASGGDLVLMALADGDFYYGIDPEIRLYDASGVLLKSGSSGNDYVEITHTLPAPSVYTLLVGDAGGNETANYTFHLQRLNGPANATPLAYGQIVTGSIGFWTERDAYTFTASAGDVVLMALADGDYYYGIDPEIRLYDASGVLIKSGSSGNDYVEITHTLPAPGVYTLLLGDTGGNNTANYTFHLQRLNGPANATPIYSGQTLTGTITQMTERDAYVFHADEDEALHIRVQRVSGAMEPEARLYAPNGELLTSRWNASRVEITDTVTTLAGQQTLLIGDYGGTETGVYTLTVTVLGATPLALGETATSLIHKYEIHFYAVAIEDAGQPLLVEVRPLTRTNQLWVQGRFGGLPIGGRYDQQTLSRTARGTYELLITPTQAGTYYFSVFGADVTAPDGTYQITVRIAARHLSDLNPRSAGNVGGVTLNLSGLGFADGMQVRLGKTGVPTITADSVTVASPTTLWAHFNLSGTAPGLYNVVGVWPGDIEQSITNAFTITTGIGPRLEAQLIVPETVRRGRQTVAWVEYTNTGDADMPAPLFVISATSSVLLSLSPDGPYTAEPVQALGVNFNQPAGTLAPGATYRIPLYFIPTLAGQIQFTLSEMVADATLVDWNAIEAEVRPPDIPDELWGVIWANFTARVGTTWANYLSVLDAQATYLAQYGNLTYDVRELFSAILGRASGVYLRQTLAASVDAYAPARGLPLTFSRVAFDTFAQRFTVGPLGRGWSHNYEYALSQPITDTIVIKGPGGGGRVFVKDGTGAWRSAAGDFGELEPLGDGTYRLRETDGLIWLFDTAGRLSYLEEPNGNRITLGYTSGQLTGLSHSNGQSFALAYNGQGRISQITDHAGQVTLFNYDAGGEHLLSVVAPGPVTTTYAYTSTATAANHALQTVTYPDNTHQYYAYDSQGRLTAQWRDGNAEQVTFTYDDLGSIFIQDAASAVTTVRLGSRGQPLEAQDPLGNRVRFQCDVDFNLIRLVQPDGGVYALTYDASGNATQSVDPLANTTSTGYTSDLSRLDWLRDARRNYTDFTYDVRGNLNHLIYPDASAEAYGYDSNGNLTSVTNRRGQTIAFTYNTLGQMTRKTYPDGRTIDYTYDARGNLTSVVDSVQGAITMQYDARSFLTRIEYPGGRWFTFEHNNAGQRTKRTGHDGYVLNYQYDAAGRLLRLTDGSSAEIVEYTYDSVGRLIREDKGNGTYSTYAYDTAGQLTSLINYAPDNSIQSRFDYTYDANGNRTSMTTLAGTTAYTYDAIGQLTGVTYPSGRQVTYAYDAVGNRITVTDNGVATQYTANDLNQYTLVGNTLYGYDADGNMTSKTEPGGATIYGYDVENHLITVTTPLSGTWRYTYDALGNRINSTHNSITTRYLHDPIGLVDVAAEYDGGGALIARYVHGLGLVTRIDAGGSAAYYAFDGTGHTRQMTAAAGVVVNTYDYDPFGVPLQTSEIIPNSFRYAGRVGIIDEVNGQLFMRARYYHAGIGRFISADPIFSESLPNLYLYARNNPINFLDPSGENPLVWALAALHHFLVHEFVKLPTDYFRRVMEEIGDVLRDAARPGMICPWRWCPVPPFPPLEPPSEEKDQGQGESIAPRDPNEKLGPPGIGPNHNVAVDQELNYTIFFENVMTATAPTQQVVVVDQLDPDLDWTTFHPTEIAFGSHVIAISAQTGGYYARPTIPDYRPAVTRTWQLDINAEIDYQTGVITWTLTTLDPLTNDLPADPLAGFLPPNDASGRGEGHVSFSVRPKAGVAWGTVITNQAAIVFDTEAVINTNVVTNTIGGTNIVYVPVILRDHIQ